MYWNELKWDKKNSKYSQQNGKKQCLNRNKEGREYFFNLEKRNNEKINIPQLKVSDGKTISIIKQTRKDIEEYYKSFLTSIAYSEVH